MRRALAFAGLACLSCSGPTAPDGPPGIPLPLGISTHETVPSWAPFTLVRRDARDLAWVPEVLAQGRTPVILVSYGDKATIPTRVARAAALYPEAWIEIWNEPNLEEFWGEAPDPEAYVRMAAACRVAAPDARLLGPAAGGATMDWEWLEAAARAGLGQQVNAISVHPYGLARPSDLSGAAARLRRLYQRPVVVSEWGFERGPSQAALVREAISAAAAARVGFLILYTWRDDPTGPQQGLVNDDGSPRPALLQLLPN